MEKQTKIRLIVDISQSISGFSPITESLDYPKYVMLSNRFKEFELWPETDKITRGEFEKELHNDSLLVDAYLDVFSTEADFFHCMVSYDCTTYFYCIMCLNKQIVMLFYRAVLIEMD